MSVITKGLQLKQVANNPIGFATDRAISFLVQLFVPIPLAGEIAVTFKKPLLMLMAAIIIGIIALFTFMATLIFAPSILLQNLGQTISHVLNPAQSLSIDALNGYFEEGFDQNATTPSKNPFAGGGLSNTTVTVNFHDFESLDAAGIHYEGIEQGIDLVPNAQYFSTNKAAKLSGGLPIILNTMKGTAHTYSDSYGAQIVEVTNPQASIKTVYYHLQQFLVADSTAVLAGQPIGVMGSTGISTGAHLEYQVRVNQNGSWTPVDPTGYIN